MKKLVCLAALAVSLGSQAQTVRFYNGSTEVNSFRRGDIITVRVSGGTGFMDFYLLGQSWFSIRQNVRLPAGFAATIDTGRFVGDWISVWIGTRGIWRPLRTLWRSG
ncbi:MAG: hypothetical protein K1X67_19395 [Fimbriimonadaceae bacterium]|nr:hypothetical protein [Fimbriimonadaceae bacterium]